VEWIWLDHHEFHWGLPVKTIKNVRVSLPEILDMVSDQQLPKELFNSMKLVTPGMPSNTHRH
jgi:hypothetical protein